MNRMQTIGYSLLLASVAEAQGYRLEGKRLVVGESDWQAWNFPHGTLEFSAAGIRPIFIRDRVNAVLDAHTFVDAEGHPGGVRDAGTNLELGVNLIDGREDTFWEPALDAPLDRWWVEIDLGRVVWARKVVVRFAEEGDPFLQFKLLTSSGLPAFSQSEALSYTVAGRSEGLNRTQRVFEFELKPSVEADPGFSGDLIQFLQIVATARAGGQAEEISEAQWNSLPEEDRGDILYFRRDTQGFLVPVDRPEYEAITDSERRGPVQHYRRERPRLAEVEVWTAGDNISLGALDRGGQIKGYGNLESEILAIDGDYKTSSITEVTSIRREPADDFTKDGGVQDPDRNIFFDLGAWYWVNRVLMVFSGVGYPSGSAFPNYAIHLSDGRRAPDGSPVYELMSARGRGGLDEQNIRLFYQDNTFAFTRGRFFKLSYHMVATYNVIRPGLRELQLYGRGFLPQVVLSSGLIELRQNPRVLSTITWDAETPPGTQVQIRTRTGNQIERQIRYFTKSGLEVTEAQYRKTLSFQRGDSLITVVPGSDWSNWSQFYPEPGAAITSPSPRRYAMVQISLLSDDPEQAALLRSLSLSLEDPLANQIVGEILPRKIEQGGQREEFTLFLRSRFEKGNAGFDQVRVELPPGAEEVGLVEVAVGTENEVVRGGGQIYGLDELEQIESGSDSLWVRLPEKVDQPAQELVALRFWGKLYLASNAFGAAVCSTEGENRVWQRVDAGEATALAEGNGMMVQTPFDGGLLGEVEVSPNPFTPNGDGINDEVEFAFSVFKVQGPKVLVLEVYSLNGRRVRKVEKVVAHAAGRQHLAWDGRDDNGRLAPPGLYLCRMGLEVDAEGAGQAMVARLISSVY